MATEASIVPQASAQQCQKSLTVILPSARTSRRVQARETPVTAVIIGLRGGTSYARGLWDRLNGGGRRAERSGMPFGLPAPRAQREARVAAIARLLRDINALEQRLQEASKARSPYFRNRKSTPPQAARVQHVLCQAINPFWWSPGQLNGQRTSHVVPQRGYMRVLISCAGAGGARAQGGHWRARAPGRRAARDGC